MKELGRDLTPEMADQKELGTIAQSGQDVCVARQPIFDARKRLHAYELLFRGGLDNFCPPGDANDAASQVLRAAWLTFGLPSLIGPNKAFTNFTRELLVAGYGKALPSNRPSSSSSRPLTATRKSSKRVNG